MDALDKKALREYRLRWRKTVKNVKRSSGYYSKGKQVVCCETGEIFESASAAERKFGKIGVGHAANTGRMCANYHWKYVKDYPENYDFSKIEKRWKPVIHEGSPCYIKQMSLDGKIINIFHNFKEIEETLGYNRNSVWRVCKGKRKTYKKYVWKFLDSSEVDESIFCA